MEFHRQQFTRVIAALSLVASIIFLLWPKFPWTLDWKSLIATIVSATAWLSLEYINFHAEKPPSVKAKMARDASKYEKVREIIDHDVIYALRTQDLCSSFSGDSWKFLEHFYAEFIVRDYDSFFDPELQKDFDDFKIKFKSFFDNFHASIYEQDGTYSWTSLDIWYSDEEYERRIKNVQKLNIVATELADDWMRIKTRAENTLTEFLTP